MVEPSRTLDNVLIIDGRTFDKKNIKSATYFNHKIIHKKFYYYSDLKLVHH